MMETGTGLKIFCIDFFILMGVPPLGLYEYDQNTVGENGDFQPGENISQTVWYNIWPLLRLTINRKSLIGCRMSIHQTLGRST